MTPGIGARSMVPPAGWLDDKPDLQRGLTPGFLVLITALAAVLRFFRLDGQSLWVDEIFTWIGTRPDAGLSFFEQMLDTIQGPLFHAAVWPLLRLQDTAIMLRLPAAVLGILAVPLFAALVARHFDTRSGRLAGLLLAVSPFHVWYSQESRGYTFVVFFALLVAMAFLRMARRGGSLGSAILLALACAALTWSNMGGLFVWVALGLSILLVFRPRSPADWGWWTLAFGLALVLTLPWILKASGIWAIDRIVPGSATGSALRGETTFNVLALPYTLFTFFFGYSLGPSLRELHEPHQTAVILRHVPVLVVAAATVGVSLLAGLVTAGRKRWLLLIWILVPALILVVLAMRNIKPWNPRYVAMILPWILTLAAVGLARLPRRPGLVCTVVLLGLSLWSLGGHYFDADYAKADIRHAAAFVDQANDLAVPVLVPVVGQVYEYYALGDSPVIRPYPLPYLTDGPAAETFVDDVLQDCDRCWLILAREWFFDPGDRLATALARRGHLRLAETAAGVRVYSWQRATQAEESQQSP